MSLLSWLIYILIGRLFIFLWSQFPLPQKLESIQTIHKLHTCPLCSGTWIYSILALCFGFDILQVLGLPHVWIISEGATGAAISFMVFIFGLGWQDYFTPEIRI